MLNAVDFTPCPRVAGRAYLEARREALFANGGNLPYGERGATP